MKMAIRGSVYRRAGRFVLAGLVAGPTFAGAQSSPDSEIDRFMERVLAQRATNSVTRRQYVVDEDERFELVGPDLTPLWRGHREFTWFARDGFLVRSPVRIDGVAIGEADRRDYEADWLAQERRRARRQARGTTPPTRRSSRSTRDNIEVATARLWGGDIEGELLEEIVDDARTWGDDQAAITAAGAAILEHRGGVAAVGFATAVERARDGVVMLETGRLGRGEVEALLVGMIPPLAAAAPEAGDAEFARFVELLELSARFELRLAPVDEALAVLAASLARRRARADPLRTVVAALGAVEPPAAAVDPVFDPASLQPRFVSEAYFLDFEFEPGNYYLAGREVIAGRDLLRIEYYPTRLFPEGDDDDPDRDDEVEARVEAGFSETSLVTLWIDPDEHQIVRFTFDNVGFGFLPGRWLFRLDDLTASMMMGQPIDDVWLPARVELAGAISLATGTYQVTYTRTFANYREAETGGRIRDVDPPPR